MFDDFHLWRYHVNLELTCPFQLYGHEVPRLSHHNFETVREKFCDVLARIKVPKIKLFFDLRVPCEDGHLAHRNAKVLMPEEDIRRDTRFYQRVEKLK